MPNNKNLLVGCIVFPILVFIAFVIGFRSVASNWSSSPIVAPNSWLLVNPSASVGDYSEVQSSEFFPLGSLSVEEMVRKIDAAARDSKIDGIVLRPRMIAVSYSGLVELSLALARFKESGKPIIAYGDMMNQRDYLLAMSADSIYLEPSAAAGLTLEGTGASITFYKGLLDKLGIKMHVLQSGAFKGAGEPYTQNSLKSGTLENYRRALLYRYEKLIADISEARKLDTEAVKAIFEQRDDYFISPSDALKMGLVDELLNRDELFAQRKISDKQLVKVESYSAAQYLKKRDKVAVVYLSGSIAPEVSGSFGYDTNISAAKVQKIIEAIKADANIKAVVFRINSGGGSALESELIYQKMMQLRSSMPVVVSMGGAAASGGYYISCASDYIIADEYTITGSIGVVMMFPEAQGLSRKIGIQNQFVGYGKFAGSFDLLSATDPAFLQSLQRNSDSVYKEFKARILATRKIEPEKLEEVAQGKIWSSTDALEHGLIDEVGSLQVAVAKAAELAGIQYPGTVSLPSQKHWMELLKTKSLFGAISGLLRKDMMNPEVMQEQILRRFQAAEWLYLMPIEVN